jgi:hypothetical protein
MSKKPVFVSFDYDNDRNYKNLLRAWDANPGFDFVFEDKTPGEINTNDVSRIKAGLTQKINEATYTLFIVGKHANQSHPNRNEIGFVNWVNFEANKSIQSGNKLAVVKIESANSVPNELVGSGYKFVSGFSETNVMNVLNAA